MDVMIESRPPPRPPPDIRSKSPEQGRFSPSLSETKSPYSKPTPLHSNTSMDHRRAEYTMRSRADSVESTRGALFRSSETKVKSNKQSHTKSRIPHAVSKSTPYKTHEVFDPSSADDHHNPRLGGPPGKLLNHDSANDHDTPHTEGSTRYSSFDVHHPMDGHTPHASFLDTYTTNRVLDDRLIQSEHESLSNHALLNHGPNKQHLHTANRASSGSRLSTSHPDAHNRCGQDEDRSQNDESQGSLTQKFIGDSSSDDRTIETWREWFFHVIYTIFWDPYNDPEFSTVQQNTWAILLGIFMGVFTAKWGDVIEFCVDFVWVTIPETLIDWGIFCNDLSTCRGLPLPHYMWICPTLFGGALSYISCILPKPIPGQNEWIDDLHRVGIMDYSTFIPLLLISTAGMASGLSLGPELPLVLSSGMVGSFVALKTKQSILSARVVNLTAGAGAIGGFFGFPMAGALFILELPHRMGLQYFEALSPATISSIFAVLVNRMVTGNDIKGYFNYPYLTSTLPSHIFYIAIVYGAIGSVIGLIYVKACLSLKSRVHTIVHSPLNLHLSRTVPPEKSKLADDGYHSRTKDDILFEQDSLLHPLRNVQSRYHDLYERKIVEPLISCINKVANFIIIESKPTRAAIAGCVCGFSVGLICMFVPHALFWGEAQLQTIIDRGKTPLPVLSNDSTSAMTAYGFCLINPNDSTADGFGIGCAALITVSKILTIAFSLSTGIVGGQFWGPLFVGCAASHFFTDFMAICSKVFGFGEILSAYPCVAILCIMGSVHTVTFRAHMAIMLILTLTVSAFSPNGGSSSSEGGDYSAVFPLLVVACYVPLMFTRSLRYYGSQHCRGDIIAIPAVLCEPRKYGTPAYPLHEPLRESDDENGDFDGSEQYSDYESSSSDSNDDGLDIKEDIKVVMSPRTASHDDTSASDIERQFFERLNSDVYASNQYGAVYLSTQDQLPNSPDLTLADSSQEFSTAAHRRTGSDKSIGLDVSSRNEKQIFRERRMRRNSLERSERGQSQERSSEHLSLVRSFGEVDTFQPCLLAQARERGSSVGRSCTPINGIPVHPKKEQKLYRQRSNSQASLCTATDSSMTHGGLCLEDAERGWNSVSNYR